MDIDYIIWNIFIKQNQFHWIDDINSYCMILEIQSILRQEYLYINNGAVGYSWYIRDIVIFCLAFGFFFGTIEILHFYQYIGKCLSRFSFVSISILTLFYLLFMNRIWHCSILLSTIEILFEMMLIKFDANEFREVVPFLGPLCFILFILLILIIFIRILKTIIKSFSK